MLRNVIKYFNEFLELNNIIEDYKNVLKNLTSN